MTPDLPLNIPCDAVSRTGLTCSRILLDRHRIHFDRHTGRPWIIVRRPT